MSARRNDGPWREECLDKRGRYCRRCKRSDGLQADHIMPRGQTGPSVVENGLILCRACHQLKTEHRILVEFHWLEPDQVEWLATVRWVAWDADGEPYGNGYRNFGLAPRGTYPQIEW